MDLVFLDSLDDYTSEESLITNNDEILVRELCESFCGKKIPHVVDECLKYLLDVLESCRYSSKITEFDRKTVITAAINGFLNELFDSYRRVPFTNSSKDKRWTDLRFTDEERVIIISICNKFKGTRNSVEDIIQDSILFISGLLRSVVIERKFPVLNRLNYINRALRNYLIDEYITKQNRDALYSSLNVGFIHLSDEDDNSLHAEDVTYSACKELSSKVVNPCPDKVLIIRQVFEGLSQKEKRLIQLYFEEKQTQADIAIQLRECQATVSNELSRLRAKIKKKLEGIWN